VTWGDNSKRGLRRKSFHDKMLRSNRTDSGTMRGRSVSAAWGNSKRRSTSILNNTNRIKVRCVCDRCWAIAAAGVGRYGLALPSSRCPPPRPTVCSPSNAKGKLPSTERHGRGDGATRCEANGGSDTPLSLAHRQTIGTIALVSLCGPFPMRQEAKRQGFEEFAMVGTCKCSSS
jgi:hypothetical protein